MMIANDCLVAAVGAALVVHIIYNRLEPRKPLYHVALLWGTPIIVVAFLHRHGSLGFIPTVLYVYPTFYVSLLCSVALYRLSPFHPLYKYPGPVINRLSMLYMCKIGASGKRYLYMQSLHEKYGPIVRFGPNHLSIVDAESIQPILGTKGIFRGELHQTFLFEQSETNLMSECDPHKHAEMRKIWHKGFTPTALKGYDPIIAKRLAQLVACLGQQHGKVDLGKWISYYKFDFMGDLVFGGGFEFMKAGQDIDGFWAMQLGGMKAATVLTHIPWIGQFLKLLVQSAGFGEQAVKSQEATKGFVETRMRTGSVTQDLFHYFAQEDQPESERPTMRRLVLDGEIAIIAASDTTTSAMSGLFYYILRDPAIFRRLQAEINAYFDQGEEIHDHQKLAEMPFLNACINETLRLMPPLLSLLQRTAPKGGATISGRFIPGGTHVLMPLYVLLRDSRYFYPDPEVFWPDRWLVSTSRSGDIKKTSTVETASIPKPFILDHSAFIPFSFGPANCIGKNLAYREMRVVIATILQKYDMRFADGFEPDSFLNGMRDDLVIMKAELPVVLSPKF